MSGENIKAQRIEKNAIHRARRVIGVLLAIFSLCYVGNLFSILGFYIPIVTYLSIVLSLVLVLTFLSFPGKKGTDKNHVPWYDLIFIVMSLCGGGYIAFFSAQWTQSAVIGFASPLETMLCSLLVLCILEGTRRTLGLILPLISLFFTLYLAFGNRLPGVLQLHIPFSVERIAGLLYFSPEGIFGLPVAVAATVFLVFIYFGGILRNSGAGDFVIDSSFALTGGWVGGPAKAAVAASTLLGTMTGGGPANVAVTGSLTIPLMKKSGYKSEFAGAVEAVSANGGILMPPVMGAAAFLMAELIHMPYWSICVSAFVPALLYYVALFTQVHYEAVKFGLRALPRKELPSLKQSMKTGWFYLIPLVFLIYFLAVARLPAQHAGLYTILILLPTVVVSMNIRHETRKGMKDICRWLIDCIDIATLQLPLPFMACAAAGIIVASVGASGLGFKLSLTMISLAHENMFILLVLIAVVSFVLGMGVPAIASYIVLAVLVAPALVDFGIPAIGAHLFVFYWGITSLITPPVALSAFVAAGIADANPFKTGYSAMRLGFVTFIYPFMFVYKPGLLMLGGPAEIAFAVVTAVIATFFLASAFEGYFVKELSGMERCLFAAGGLLVMMPGYLTTGVGGGLIFAVSLFHWRSARKYSYESRLCAKIDAVTTIDP